MRLSVDKRVRKILDSFSSADRAKIDRVVELFIDKGFAASEIYLKKLSKNLWELRPGKIRLLFGMVDDEAIVVNVFIKKAKRTPLKEIKLAENRLGDYL